MTHKLSAMKRVVSKFGAYTNHLTTLSQDSTVKEVDKKGLEHWPTYSAVLKKLVDRDGEVEYQLQTLTHVAQAKAHYSANAAGDCSSVISCLKSRLAWTDLQFVRDVIVYLEKQGWQKLVDEEFTPDSDSENDLMEPIERLRQRFQIPLQSAGVDIDRLPEESHEMVLHATQFISLSTMGYRAVWW